MFILKHDGRGGEESFINEVTFTGSVRDLGSGLQYMNARYYDPATGRFVSQDTYTGTPYAPWTQHLYSYCGNNPVNMVDPTGHMPIKPIAVNDGGVLVLCLNRNLHQHLNHRKNAQDQDVYLQ